MNKFHKYRPLYFFNAFYYILLLFSKEKKTGLGAKLGKSNILTVLVQAAARYILSGDISIRFIICF